MIRILHIVGKMDMGGIETLLMNVFREIDREKIMFDFLVHSNENGVYDNEIIKLGGKIFRITSRNESILKNRKDLEDFFNRTSYDIVHMHVSSLSYITPLIYAKKFGVSQRIIHSHSTKLLSNNLSKILHKIRKPYIGLYATDYVSCSENAGKWLFPKSILNSNKYKIIYNGINIRNFQFNEQNRNEIRSELKIENKIVFGHIGRFSKIKNHDFLIEIFFEYHKVNPQSILICIGDGDTKSEIIEKCKNMKIDDSVLFLGVRNDVNKLIYCFDVFVFPSLFEGLGIAIIEAQIAGIPCYMSSEVPSEVIKNENVEIFDLTDDPKSIAEKIRLNSLKRIEKHNKDLLMFDIQNCVNELCKLYFHVRRVDDIWL